MGYTYSFLDVQAAISGPGGNFPLAGDESGNAEEGVTIEPTGDKNIMTVGADGSVMHSLKGDRSGTVTVRLLKTSTINAALQALYNYQTTSSSRHGQNTITIRDVARGDTITCQKVAFAKNASKTYDGSGGIMEWTFHAGTISALLGA